MRKLRMGMVGGGPGSLIGDTHRKAAELDGMIELVCGAFSSDPDKSKMFGAELGIDDKRAYENYNKMIEKEFSLPLEERMDFLSIVTPNYLHFEPAKIGLEHGFHVICDKPLTMDSDQANELMDLVEKTGLQFAITYTYTGYPMVKEARELVKTGVLGAVRKVIVDYSQGWLYSNIENSGHKQASWRVDPAKSGKGGSLGDIGTHAFNLAEYISGLQITEVCAEVSSFVENRQLDDDCNILIRLENGAKGILSASQICVGEENALTIRVYGDKAGLEWRQMEPDSLILKFPDQANKVLRAGQENLSEISLNHSRLPPGHPEGVIEAFANIYRNYALSLAAKIEGKSSHFDLFDFPTINDGLRGMFFIEKSVESGGSNQKWIRV